MCQFNQFGFTKLCAGLIVYLVRNLMIRKSGHRLNPCKSRTLAGAIEVLSLAPCAKQIEFLLRNTSGFQSFECMSRQKAHAFICETR